MWRTFGLNDNSWLLPTPDPNCCTWNKIVINLVIKMEREIRMGNPSSLLRVLNSDSQFYNTKNTMYNLMCSPTEQTIISVSEIVL